MHRPPLGLQRPRKILLEKPQPVVFETSEAFTEVIGLNRRFEILERKYTNKIIELSELVNSTRLKVDKDISDEITQISQKVIDNASSIIAELKANFEQVTTDGLEDIVYERYDYRNNNFYYIVYFCSGIIFLT